jgi:transposase-like protein
MKTWEIIKSDGAPISHVVTAQGVTAATALRLWRKRIEEANPGLTAEEMFGPVAGARPYRQNALDNYGD